MASKAGSGELRCGTSRGACCSPSPTRRMRTSLLMAARNEERALAVEQVPACRFGGCGAAGGKQQLRARGSQAPFAMERPPLLRSSLLHDFLLRLPPPI